MIISTANCGQQDLTSVYIHTHPHTHTRTYQDAERDKGTRQVPALSVPVQRANVITEVGVGKPSQVQTSTSTVPLTKTITINPFVDGTMLCFEIR